MAKAGLLALADSYGLARQELDELRELATAFFGRLREALAQIATTSIKLVEVGQQIEGFAVRRGVATTGFPTIAMGRRGRLGATFDLEQSLARPLIDAIFGTSAAPVIGGSVTATEARVLHDVIRQAFLSTASQMLIPLIGGDDDGIVELPPSEAASLLREAEETNEPILSLSGHFRIDDPEGGMTQGAMTLGLRLGDLLSSRGRALPERRPRDRASAARRARRALGDAEVPLTAMLGELNLPFALVSAWAPGSVILLGQMRQNLPRVELRAAGAILFQGTVVADRGWYRFLIQPWEEAGGQSKRE